MEKILSFEEKINIILKIKQLSLKEMEREMGYDGTLYKAINENRAPKKKTIDEILRKFHVKQTWWDNPVGDTAADVFEENPTHDDIEPAIPEFPLRVDKVYKDLVEGNSDYSLIPKTVLAGEYRLVLDRDIAWRNFMVQSIIDGKNETISQLKDRIEKAEKRIEELTNSNGSGSRKAGPKGVHNV